ncbi:hypothetical protein [Oenococcus oeni]|uniref:hypothetical protein n=1 Tax=Oenococcus oeni TaxID=1247 RepID=UPI0010B15E18|nr:hypothetical protein [Oenococcus oeni]SYW13067.1 membrane hypothetical protein [Oenococcus oeni]
MEKENKLIIRRLIAGIGLLILDAYYVYITILGFGYLAKVNASIPETNKYELDTSTFLISYFVQVFISLFLLFAGVTYITYCKKHLTKTLNTSIVILGIISMFLFSVYYSSKDVDGYLLMAFIILGMSFSSMQNKDKKTIEIKKEKTNKSVENTTNLEQMKELKKMLDQKLITKKEFKAKKKQILGL